MRVMLILQTGKYGGANKMLYWLASQLHSSGHETSVVAIEQCENIDRYSNGWEFISLNVPKYSSFIKRNTIGVAKGMKMIWNCISDHAPEVIISFCDHSFYETFLCSKLKGIKLLISERVDPYSSRSKTDKLRRSLYRFADAGVFQTEHAMKFFPKKLQKNSIVIPNPVRELDQVMQWNADEAKKNKSVLYLGRLDNTQKRLDVLLNAFAKVHERLPEYRFDVYGDGYAGEVEYVKELIDELGLQGCVELRGVTNQVYEVLSRSSVFVLTSDYEGIPNSVIEAMAVGIPVVSTDCSPGGARLLLGDSEYGELVPRGDSSAVAEAIIRVLNDIDKAAQKAEAGKASLERFDEKKIAGKWIEFIERIGRKK